jgi:hypothetical protein
LKQHADAALEQLLRVLHVARRIARYLLCRNKIKPARFQSFIIRLKLSRLKMPVPDSVVDIAVDECPQWVALGKICAVGYIVYQGGCLLLPLR